MAELTERYGGMLRWKTPTVKLTGNSRPGRRNRKKNEVKDW